MKRSNKIYLGIFVGGLALGLGGLYKEHRKPGTLAVLAPLDSPARVVVDGRKIEVPAGDVLRTPLAHGVHTVEVEAPQPRSARVVIESGRNVIAVPVLDEQCFVELDVTISHYGDTAGRFSPKVTQRFRHREPFHPFGSLAERELPGSAKETVNRKGKIVKMELVHLLRPVPCSAVDDDDAALAALGYRGGPR